LLFQPTEAPSFSNISRIGTNGEPFLMIGVVLNDNRSPFTYTEGVIAVVAACEVCPSSGNAIHSTSKLVNIFLIMMALPCCKYCYLSMLLLLDRLDNRIKCP